MWQMVDTTGALFNYLGEKLIGLGQKWERQL